MLYGITNVFSVVVTEFPIDTFTRTALLDAMGKLIFLRRLKPFKSCSVIALPLVCAVNQKRTNFSAAELHEPMETKPTKARQNGWGHLVL